MTMGTAVVVCTGKMVQIQRAKATSAADFEVDLTSLPSPVLARLIAEARLAEVQEVSAYSRWHNRHNRSR